MESICKDQRQQDNLVRWKNGEDSRMTDEERFGREWYHPISKHDFAVGMYPTGVDHRGRYAP